MFIGYDGETSGGNYLVWNVMYDDFLRMDLPAGTSIIGFADDALVVCAADHVKILEVRINDSLWWAKRWLDSRCLKMAPEKTEALLVTDRRSFKYPRIVLGEHEIECSCRTFEASLCSSDLDKCP